MDKMFCADVVVLMRPEITEPKGHVIRDELLAHDYSVTKLELGKHIKMELKAPDMESARAMVQTICKKFLSNPVVEMHTFQLQEIGEV